VLLITDRAQDVVHKLAGVRTDTSADLLLKECLNIFIQCDRHDENLSFRSGIVEKVGKRLHLQAYCADVGICLPSEACARQVGAPPVLDTLILKGQEKGFRMT
jgi:hypothetical protein